MIWSLSVSGSSAEKSAVVSHIAAEIAEVCGDDRTIDTDDVEALAKAIETFLEREHSGGSADSRYLVMLASKALTSIGYDSAGRRMLVFGTGLVKPSEWEVTGDDAMWVLDLKEMMINEDSPLEIIFFSSLSMVVEAIAEVWDKTSGQGILGLKNVFSTAVALLGSDGHKSIGALEEEIKSNCDKKLQQLGKERNWNTSPRVMNLDI